MPETLVFYLLSGLAIVSSTLVIGQRNPMYSVLLLVASFGALAGLYIQLDAPFVAVAQIIIYAGAVMVLFLFVVMLLNAPQEDAAEWDRTHPLRQPAFARFGALLALLLVVQLLWALLTAAGSTMNPFTPRPSARRMVPIDSGGGIAATNLPKAAADSAHNSSLIALPVPASMRNMPGFGGVVSSA